ncbi:nucleotide pyrophosphohydrolase [Cephaloticoccus capnophilus]|uniref:Nucleotide pyrophosphohydrolase n=1 Tax=Cephaloticoccus capnophilus TaxID=1548208 RepID=A0A139SID5_9BACT|nr:MazG family protein [Cephaloticoccus capnophilus]KXU34335.1 nucleotide pyrophosphohydrolase [Cephaloticoccus capnophilus]
MSQAIDELRRTIARLRGPGGCPWDQEQTHESLVRCLIDEVSELIETIDQADMPHMREELGDVLIQVVFHAQLAEEAGHFDLDDVAREVNAKLIRRHPHVFGEGAARTAVENTAQLFVQWDAIKAQEKAARGVSNASAQPRLFKAQPPRLPALMFAEGVWKQARKQSLTSALPVEVAQIAQRAEGLDEAQLGRALFELCAAAQQAGLNPEDALRRWTSQLVDHAEAVSSPAANAHAAKSENGN